MEREGVEGRKGWREKEWRGGGMEREGVEGRRDGGWRGTKDGIEEGMEGRKGWNRGRDGGEEGMEGGIAKKRV